MKQHLSEIHKKGLWQVLVIFLVGAAVVLWTVRLLTATAGLPRWTPTMALVLLTIALPFILVAAFIRDTAADATNPLSGLITELHRRSLWQVMGIFLAGSWGTLQVVEVIVETAGLPDWTATMALVLLLIGLPVCLATAFVQDGTPVRVGEPAEPTTPSESSAASQRARGLLTWRNALLGGVSAFTLLGVLAGGYLLMWSAGIGPLGNLVAQGVIDRGERVILADFLDRTGEGLGDAVTAALRVDLLETSVLELVEKTDIARTLELMQGAPDARLSAEVAREVALRDGIAAIIDGEVATVGSGYIVTAILREAASGRSLASFRVTAKGPEDVIASIEALSRDIREKSGESLRTVRAGLPLSEVTTSSLEALKLHTQAVAIHNTGDLHGSAEILGQAVAVDSTFAMAWRLLGIVASDPTRKAAALTNAFRYRDRIQGVERYLVEALYFTTIVGDNSRAMEAYRSVLRVDPDNPSALNNLAERHRLVGEWEEALELYARAAPRHAVPYSNLVRTLTWMGQFDEAASTLEGFVGAYPGHSWVDFLSFGLHLSQGDLEGAARFAGPPVEDASRLTNSSYALRQAQLAHWSGRLDEARAFYERGEALRGSRPATAWAARLVTAYEENLVGDAEWAHLHVRQGFESEFHTLPPIAREHWQAALRLARSGDADNAESVIEDWEETIPEEWKGPIPTSGMERAALYARAVRGDTAGATEAIDRLLVESACTDACWLFGRARVHDWSGATDEAIELYERVLGFGYDLGNSDGINVGERLHAMMRLGPLYESVGDTARALTAYQRLVDQWANGDERGMETVLRFRGQIAALGG